MAIKHTFVSTKVDSSDPTKIQPSHWNADHDTSELFVEDETPTGVINGENRTFVLANPPVPMESLQVFLNGLLLKEGVGYDLSGPTVLMKFGNIPQSGDIVWANYKK